jgi:ABC-2 type transport system ATP-binding protein
MTASTPAIQVAGLRKVFLPGRSTEVVALDGVDLAVQRGEIFGFLGRNGAGKTTTVKILIDMIRRYEGTCEIFGRSTREAAARERVGFLPESSDLHGWLTAEEVVSFHGELQGLPSRGLRQRAREALTRAGLEEKAWLRPVGGYSKGMHQRVGLAIALVGDPDLLFLDEPTANLDPIGRKDVKDLLLELEQQGKTVFLNSHLLSDVELTCHRVAILERGRIIRQGDVLDLTHLQPYARIRTTAIPEGLLAELREMSSDVAVLDGVIVVRIRTEDDLDPLPSLIERHGARLRELTVARESLEEVFLQTLGAAEGEGASAQ